MRNRQQLTVCKKMLLANILFQPLCSNHFVDGAHTLENPHPTLQMGYEKPSKKARRTLLRQFPKAESGDLPTQGEDDIVIQRRWLAEDVHVEGNSNDRCLPCNEKQAAIDCLRENVAILEN